MNNLNYTKMPSVRSDLSRGAIFFNKLLNWSELVLGLRSTLKWPSQRPRNSIFDKLTSVTLLCISVQVIKKFFAP